MLEDHRLVSELLELYSRRLIRCLPKHLIEGEKKLKLEKARLKLFTMAFFTIVIISFTPASMLLFAPLSEDGEASLPMLSITAKASQSSYLLRQKVDVSGNITLDGSPASNLSVIVLIKNPVNIGMVYRTLQIGNPTETWYLTITDLFLTDTNGNAINTVKPGTQVKCGMTLYNGQLTTRDAFATFTIFDANNVPLATKTWSGTLNPHQYAGPIYPISIPSWACSGKALIVGNVYTQEPEDGGIALSPEKTTYYCISRLQQGLLEYPSLPPPPPQTTPGFYSVQMGLSPEPMAGSYVVNAVGQVNPMIKASALTVFTVQNSAGYPPQASFIYWPTQPYVNMTANFDASSSTPEGFNDSITEYEWDFGDGTPRITETDPTITHAYMQGSTFIVTLNVTDNEGLWSTTSKPITILPEYGPKANFTWVPKPTRVNATTTFDASQSTIGWSKTAGEFSPIVSYAWNFSDGSGIITVPNPTINHNFTQPGNYSVTMTVTDRAGRSDAASATVQVQNITAKAYDINGDGKIDGLDLIIVAHAYGSIPGKPFWDPRADINGDGKVDGSDLILVARHYGEDP
jgi:PKD repeat protein